MADEISFKMRFDVDGQPLSRSFRGTKKEALAWMRALGNDPSLKKWGNSIDQVRDKIDKHRKALQKMPSPVGRLKFSLDKLTNTYKINNVQMNKSVVTADKMRKSFEAAFSIAKTNILGRLSGQIAKFEMRMSAAKKPTTEMVNALAALRNQYNKLSQVNMGNISSLVDSQNMKSFNANLNAWRRTQAGATQGLAANANSAFAGSGNMKNAGKSMWAGLASSASTGLGFTAIEIGTEIQNMFSNRRVAGQVRSAGGQLAGSIGNIFSYSLGSITRDIGEFAGTISELFFNMMTFKFRALSVAFGGLIKGFGYAIASAGFGASVGAIGGPLGIVAGAGIGVALGAALGFLHGALGFIQEFVEEALDIGTKLFQSLKSIFSAGIKIIGGILKIGAKGILSTLKALFGGVKEIFKNIFETIKNVSVNALDTLAKTIVEATQHMMKFRAETQKAGKEVLDAFGEKGLRGMERLNESIRSKYGFSGTEVNKSLFIAASSGLGRGKEGFGEISGIANIAAKLAKMDDASLETSMNALVVAGQNYGGGTANYQKYAENMAAATTVGMMDLEEMGRALPTISGYASALGISFEDMSTAIALMTRFGGKGSAKRSATYLTRLLEAIYMPGSAGAEAFASIGLDLEGLKGDKFGKNFEKHLRVLAEKMASGELDLSELREFMPLAQQRRAALQLAKDPEGFSNIKKEMESVKKAQEEAFQRQMDLSLTRLERFSQSIKIIKDRLFGTSGESILNKVLNDKILKGFEYLVSKVGSSQMTKALTQFSDSIAGTLIPILMKAMKLLNSFFDLLISGELVNNIKSRFGYIIEIFGTLKGYVSKVVSGFGLMKINMQDVYNVMTVVDNVAKMLYEKLMSLTKITFSKEGFMEGLKSFAESMLSQLRFVAANFSVILIGYLTQGITGLISFIKSGAGNLNLTPTYANTGSSFKEFGSILLSITKIAIYELLNLISPFMNNFMNDFGKTFSSMFYLVKDGFLVIDSMYMTAVKILEAIGKLGDIIVTLGGRFMSLFGTDVSDEYSNKMKPILKELGKLNINSHSDLGKAIISTFGNINEKKLSFFGVDYGFGEDSVNKRNSEIQKEYGNINASATVIANNMSKSIGNMEVYLGSIELILKAFQSSWMQDYNTTNSNSPFTVGNNKGRDEILELLKSPEFIKSLQEMSKMVKDGGVSTEEAHENLKRQIEEAKKTNRLLSEIAANLTTKHRPASTPKGTSSEPSDLILTNPGYK